jgi:hypothetical protein
MEWCHDQLFSSSQKWRKGKAKFQAQAMCSLIRIYTQNMTSPPPVCLAIYLSSSRPYRVPVYLGQEGKIENESLQNEPEIKGKKE